MAKLLSSVDAETIIRESQTLEQKLKMEQRKYEIEFKRMKIGKLIEGIAELETFVDLSYEKLAFRELLAFVFKVLYISKNEAVNFSILVEKL